MRWWLNGCHYTRRCGASWTILEDGIDPSQTDDEGYSALQAAAENDHLAVVKLLVDKGANVAYLGEYTALQLAEMTENNEVAAYLKSR